MFNKSGYCDFHCHLDDDCFDENRHELIDRCFAQGITNMISVVDPFKAASLEKTGDMLACHPGIHAICGAHPHQADSYTPEIEKRVVEYLKKDRVMAVGEVGLDYHYDFSSRENQQKVLSRQIAIARELMLPLVIHSRSAEADVLKLLDKENFSHPVIFHCFTGNMAAAEEILQRGFYISISGIITFKKADALREIVKIIPLAQLFSETDSPYLSPEPRRGEINTPLAVMRVVEKISAVKGTAVEEINEAIFKNLLRLISKNVTR